MSSSTSPSAMPVTRSQWISQSMPEQYLDFIASHKHVSVALVNAGDEDGFAEEMPDKIEINKDELIQSIQKNIETSMKLCESFFSAVNRKYKASKIFLRFTSPLKFDAIILVSKKDFFSKDFIKMYGAAHRFVTKHGKKNFELKFSFMPLTQGLDFDLLASDGYFFSYEKQPPRSRKT